MHELLVRLTEAAGVMIDLMALAAICFGTIEAFVRAVRAALSGAEATPAFRPIWLRYARWLVAGLTFQLAADIIDTSIAPTWDDIGRLAAIAVVRTFLNYFLERDVSDAEGEQKVMAARPSA
jgi:uncharacterized membrane protein